MTNKPGNDHSDGASKGGLHGPFDGFTAATAVGFAMAAQAMDMWFGVMSGVARASRVMLDPHDKDQEPPAYVPGETPASAKAKSAARTVVADIQRTAEHVAEVAVDLLGGPTPEPSAEKAEIQPLERTAVVVAFEPKPAEPKAAKVAKARNKARKKTQPRAVKKAKPELTAPVQAQSPEPAPEPGLVTAVEIAEAKVEAPVEPEKRVDAPGADQPLDNAVEASPEPGLVTAVDIAEAKIEAPVEPEKPVDAPVTDKPLANAVKPSPAPSAIMPDDFRQPKAIDKPEAPDDLKLVAGVGPKLEAVLNGLGVWTFSQVADWQPEEVAWVDDYLGLSGRIARDSWIAQAAALANGVKAVDLRGA